VASKRTEPSRLVSSIVLILILAGAAALRLYGLHWDGGFLYHPDERQILVVANRLAFPWPPDWQVLLSPESPWNPSFFSYGSLPLYLLRLCSWGMARVDPAYGTLESSYVVGRVLSALFDLGSVALVYLLGRKLYNRWVGLLAAGLLATTVLHVQMAHFYTVDTLLVFFILLTLLLALRLLERRTLGRGLAVGGTLGLALATKVSAAPLALPVALAWLFGALPETRVRIGWRAWATRLLGLGAVGLVALLTFVVCEPYAVIDVITFIIDVYSEGQMARGASDIPYTRQFIGTLPYVYPAWQAMLWSMGLPLGVAGFAGLLAQTGLAVSAAIRRQLKARLPVLLMLSWALIYFALVGSFHVKFLRYMLPILPLLCLWAAWGLWQLLSASGRPRGLWRVLGWAATLLVVGTSTLYAVAYVNLYREPHPWIQATAWLCENLPARSRLVHEHWDDPLPMRQGTGELRCYYDYRTTTLPIYDPDDTAKLETLLSAIEESDYIVLSSNRLYNTIPRLSERYPMTSRYYELLMGEQLGYELVYYAASYPNLCGVALVDDTFSDPPLPVPALLARDRAEGRQWLLGRADESYSVYDHPLALVFAKTEQHSREDLLALFGAAAEGLPEPEPEEP